MFVTSVLIVKGNLFLDIVFLPEDKSTAYPDMSKESSPFTQEYNYAWTNFIIVVFKYFN
jgi:hypothetical protein